MKRLLSILFLLACCWTAQAGTVSGSFSNIFGENFNGNIWFIPTNVVQQVGSTTIVPTPTRANIVHSILTNQPLVTGWYTVKFKTGADFLPLSFNINMPNDSEDHNIYDLSTNITVYTYTNPAVLDVAAGSGVTVVTNGFLRTISSNADLSNATNNDTVIATGLTNQISANASAINGKVAIANNGTDFANPLLTASNIAVIGISNQTTLPAKANLSGITGKYPGQLLITQGGGAGGGGIHQIYIWNTNNGTANWDGGLEIPGMLVAYSTVQNNKLFASNGVDNCVEFRNYDRTHYSAARWTEAVGGAEKGAIGYGNDQTPYYTYNNYLEDFGNQQGFYFASSSHLHGGLWRVSGTNGNAVSGRFVWLKANTSADHSTNVTFLIEPTGATRMSGALVVSNIAGIEGILRTGPGASTGSGEAITVSNGKLNTTALDPTTTATLGKINAVVTGGTSGTPGNPFLDLAGNGTGFNSTGYHLSIVVNSLNRLTFQDVGGWAKFTNGCKVGINGIVPLSDLDVGGSIGGGAYVSKSSSYSLGANDFMVEVTATGQTMTLPDATACLRREYLIKLTASGSCTVGTTSAQTIDGSTTYSLSAQYKYVRVKSNGSNWLIIANN